MSIPYLLIFWQLREGSTSYAELLTPETGVYTTKVSIICRTVWYTSHLSVTIHAARRMVTFCYSCRIRTWRFFYCSVLVLKIWTEQNDERNTGTSTTRCTGESSSDVSMSRSCLTLYQSLSQLLILAGCNYFMCIQHICLKFKKDTHQKSYNTIELVIICLLCNDYLLKKLL